MLHYAHYNFCRRCRMSNNACMPLEMHFGNEMYLPGGGFHFPGFLGFSVGNFILDCSLIHEMVVKRLSNQSIRHYS